MRNRLDSLESGVKTAGFQFWPGLPVTQVSIKRRDLLREHTGWKRSLAWIESGSKQQLQTVLDQGEAVREIAVVSAREPGCSIPPPAVWLKASVSSFAKWENDVNLTDTRGWNEPIWHDKSGACPYSIRTSWDRRTLLLIYSFRNSSSPFLVLLYLILTRILQDSCCYYSPMSWMGEPRRHMLCPNRLALILDLEAKFEYRWYQILSSKPLEYNIEIPQLQRGLDLVAAPHGGLQFWLTGSWTERKEQGKVTYPVWYASELSLLHTEQSVASAVK